MRRSEPQTDLQVQKLLPINNTTAPALSPFNNPRQFSDADRISPYLVPNLSPTDPRMLIATMTKTRHQCRTAGLIRRDISELIQIGKTLELTPVHTKQIITIASQNPYIPELNDTQVTELASIPFLYTQKKTRIPIRVFVGLSIWAITIAVAMQMV